MLSFFTLKLVQLHFIIDFNFVIMVSQKRANFFLIVHQHGVFSNDTNDKSPWRNIKLARFYKTLELGVYNLARSSASSYDTWRTFGNYIKNIMKGAFSYLDVSDKRIIPNNLPWSDLVRAFWYPQEKNFEKKKDSMSK